MSEKPKGAIDNRSDKQCKSALPKNIEQNAQVSYKVSKLSKRTTFSKCFHQSCDVLFGIRSSKCKYHRFARVGKETHYLVITNFKLALIALDL